MQDPNHDSRAPVEGGCRMDSRQEFPNLCQAIDDGIRRRLHTGLQVYISRDGHTLLDSGFGESSETIAVTAETRMLWRSAGKPLTAALLLMLLSEQQLSVQLPLGDVLPAAGDKGRLTLQQLLTHQGGFPETDTGWPHVSWDESVQRVLDTPGTLAPGSAAYHPQSSWFLLAEVIRCLDSGPRETRRDFAVVLRERLLQPAGLLQTSCGVGEQAAGQNELRLCPDLYERKGGQLQKSVYSAGPWRSTPSAGGNLRGPVRELGCFYELLMRQGRLPNGAQLIPVESIRLMTQRHRTGAFDSVLQHQVDFGLGLICNSARYGADTVPYGFGTPASDSSFGHGGAQCSLGFCDPEHRIVVAWAANAFCGEGQHQRRNRQINDAIWRDLGTKC